MRGSIDNQVQQIWHILDGIGQSKYNFRKESNYKSQSSQNVSEKVHSFRYKDEVIRTAKELGYFAKNNFQIQDMQQIHDNVILSFFEIKIEDECSYRTISTYISHLEKVHIALAKMKSKIEKHDKLFTRKALIEARKNAKEFAFNHKKQNRAYKNPLQIISLLPKEYSFIAKLQLHYGLRVIEAAKIKLSQLDEETNSFTFQGKGGYKLTKTLDKKIYLEVRNSIIASVNNGKNGLFISYSTYASELKKAVIACTEKWNSTHGLRYNYAQNRFKFYLDSGETENEALKLVSEDLGHHRAEITGTYLS